MALNLLDDPQRGAVEALAALHVEKHGDTVKSLAALNVGPSTHKGLKAAVGGDTEAEATLARVGPGLSGPHTEVDDAQRTTSYVLGPATGEGGRFRVLRPYAQGGLGAVFVAVDGELNREVALKQILPQFADDPASRQRFMLEAEITGGLEHPGIVPVYGLGSYDAGRSTPCNS